MPKEEMKDTADSAREWSFDKELMALLTFEISAPWNRHKSYQDEVNRLMFIHLSQIRQAQEQLLDELESKQESYYVMDEGGYEAVNEPLKGVPLDVIDAKRKELGLK